MEIEISEHLKRELARQRRRRRVATHRYQSRPTRREVAEYRSAVLSIGDATARIVVPSEQAKPALNSKQQANIAAELLRHFE